MPKRWTLLLGMMAWAMAQEGLDWLQVERQYTNIPLSQIQSGGPPPQGIPALGFGGDWTGQIAATAPVQSLPQTQVDWLEAQEPVVVLQLGKESRAYPLQILTWHEIANDQLNQTPIAVTFCPLCNSALAFDRRIPLSEPQRQAVLKRNPKAPLVPLDAVFRQAYQAQQGSPAPQWGLLVSFGTSGMLYNSNLLMFDSATNTLFSQLLGEGHVGTLMGVSLLRYPAQVLGYAQFAQHFPQGTVLSRQTGFSRNYGRNPYVGYDQANQKPFLYNGPLDGRLPPKERVVTVALGSQSVAYPFVLLSQKRLINDRVGNVALVVFWQPGSRSVLDSSQIVLGRDIGAVGVFERTLGGRTLSFEWDGQGFVDQQTKSRWNLLGKATAGPLRGQQLKAVVHDNTLWFAWAAFKPQTRIYAP